jgi:hypothetical protein
MLMTCALLGQVVPALAPGLALNIDTRFLLTSVLAALAPAPRSPSKIGTGGLLAGLWPWAGRVLSEGNEGNEGNEGAVVVNEVYALAQLGPPVLKYSSL